LFFALIEKVIVYKARTAEVPFQQLGLPFIRVQSELICSVNLSEELNIIKSSHTTIGTFTPCCFLQGSPKR
jgi:hypothetical protein